jgi:NlpC/P60 family putative phage cell wall peptidase
MSADARCAAIVAEARRWIGTPYRHQASLRGVGCDCLGLVRGVWRSLIGPEPEAAGPYTRDWAEAGGRERLAEAGARYFVEVPANSFAAGDVLLFRWRAGVPAKHLAVATSARTMIHAHDGAAVCEVAIAAWWRRRIAHAYAFPARRDVPPAA